MSTPINTPRIPQSMQAQADSPARVYDRRAAAARVSPPVSMFFRMLVRAAVLRRRRAASAVLAMVVAAAVATAMLNLYVDVQAKLRTEFRNYGANIVIAGKDGQALSPEALAQVQTILGPKALAIPVSYAVARTSSGQSVVVVGTDFPRVRQLNRWWKVSRWPDAPGQALLGVRTTSVVGANRQPFELAFQGKTMQLTPSGMLQTGAAEDSRIYLDQSDFQNWTGVAPSTIEIALNGTAPEVEASIRQLALALPRDEVRPVRQILEGEANVLTKTRATLLASASLLILTSGLCVLATLMGWVFDRRRDFAMMKTLGASERLIDCFFAAEAAALGVAGAIPGFLVGIGIAAWIGRVNFHAPVVPRFGVFPYVLGVSVAVALLSAILPIALLRRVQPAIILRGE